MAYRGSLQGKSSLFRIVVAPGSSVYRYNVRIVSRSPTGGEFSLTRQTEPSLKSEENKVCRQIVQLAFAQSNVGITEDDYCHDGKSILYSRKKFPEITAEFHSDAVARDPAISYRFRTDSTIHVNIVQNETAPEVHYSDFSKALVSDDYTSDHTVRTFLELVTSEFFVRGGQWHNAQPGVLFQSLPTLTGAQATRLGPGVQMFEGIQKGVRIVDKDTALLVLDMRRSVMYASADQRGRSISLAQVYEQFAQHYRHNAQHMFEELFRGVRLTLDYNNGRTITFHGLSQHPISHPNYNVGGRSLPTYFREEHGIGLNYENQPGVQTSSIGVDHNVVYPLELLRVMPGQLLPQEKNPPEFENSVLPADRYRFIMQHVEVLTNGDGAQYLDGFGIRVLPQNDINISCLPLPRIRFGGRREAATDNKGGFSRDLKQNAFLHPFDTPIQWYLAYDPQVERHVQAFIMQLRDLNRRANIQLPDPFIADAIALDQMEEVFKQATKTDGTGADFIVYLDDKAANSHGVLKLYEAHYKVLTQHVTTKSLERLHQALIGVIAKLNSKCGGIVYMPTFDRDLSAFDIEQNGDLLVIGYGVVHPTQAAVKELQLLKNQGYGDYTSLHPSVVGVCANKSFHPGIFAGDFFYQETRREVLSQPRLEKAIAEIIQCTFAASEGRRKPTRILVIRNGVSEGQFKMVSEIEIPSIITGYQLGMQQIGDEALAKSKPKITFLIANKRHNKRFFRLNQGRIDNTMPGDAITSTVTRTDVEEFFLQTHFALKGTAQLTQYTVLLNQLGLSMALIQKLMLHLAYMHQVSSCPTSLPVPVRVADETAKRGQQVYNEFRRLIDRATPDQHVALLAKFGVDMSEDLQARFDSLTNAFCYVQSPLEQLRYNA